MTQWPLCLQKTPPWLAKTRWAPNLEGGFLPVSTNSEYCLFLLVLLLVVIKCVLLASSLLLPSKPRDLPTEVKRPQVPLPVQSTTSEYGASSPSCVGALSTGRVSAGNKERELPRCFLARLLSCSREALCHAPQPHLPPLAIASPWTCL